MEELRRLAALAATLDRTSYEEALLRVSRERPDLLSETVVPSEPKLKLVSGAKKGRQMPNKTATEQIDAAVGAMLQADPKLTKQQAIRQLAAKRPALFEQQRQEGLDKSAAGRQAFAEAQSKCRIVGGGSAALAAASRVLENSESAWKAEPAPASSSRTMDELSRLVAEAKKRNPKLDDGAARKQIFTQRPDLYDHYRRATTRNTRRSR